MRVLVNIITISWLTKSEFWVNIIIKIITICWLTKSYIWGNIDNQNIISMIHNIYYITFLWDLIWSYTSFKLITMLWHFKCIKDCRVNVLDIRIDAYCKISRITMSWSWSVVGVILSIIHCVLKIIVHYGSTNFRVSPLRITKWPMPLFLNGNSC